MIRRLQKKYALSQQGAKDLVKGCIACVVQNLSFLFPVGFLYRLVCDLLNGGVPGTSFPFYFVAVTLASCGGTASGCGASSISSSTKSGFFPRISSGIAPDKCKAILAHAGPIISYKTEEERMMAESILPIASGSMR